MKTILLGLSASALLLMGAMPLVGNAQTTTDPQFLFTWHASNSYVPSFYQGKTLPNIGSQVTASLDLVSQGKIVNIKNQTVYWYLNGNFIGGGVGAQEITFSPGVGAPNSFALEVKLPSYNGNLLIHTVNIPVVQPQAVIVAPYPNNQFSANPVTFQAEGYFFNASSLSSLGFAWSADGQSAANTENPTELQVTLPQGTPSGSSLSVGLTVTNSLDSTTAMTSANLTYESIP
jgi:hypothetical protein